MQIQRNYTHVVTIEHDTGGDDGYGSKFETWTTLYSDVPAQVKPVSSRELWSGEQVKTQATHRVYLRWAPDIDSACRLVFEDRIFTITGVIDLEEKHAILEVSCLEQQN